jgi:predicted metal-dependent hydrolase
MGRSVLGDPTACYDAGGHLCLSILVSPVHAFAFPIFALFPASGPILVELRRLSKRLPRTVRINELPVAVEVVPSIRRKKTVSMEVHQSKIVLRVPASLSSEVIYDLVEKRRQWILDKWQEVKSLPPQQHWYNADTAPQDILLYGQQLPVVHVTEQATTRFALTHRDNRLTIVRPSKPYTEQFLSETTRGLVVSWLRKTARRDFAVRLDKWASVMKVSYRDFRLKDQKTRWGSCSSLGNINLNWRLIQAPDWVIDYVVIHELAHLHELNHSPSFWSIVGRYCPNYGEAKNWLKAHSAKLLLW